MQLILTNRVYVALIWLAVIMIGCIVIKYFRSPFFQKISFNFIVTVMTYILGLFVTYIWITKGSSLEEIMWLQPLFMMEILSLPREKEGNIKVAQGIKIFGLAVFLLAPTSLPLGYELLIWNVIANIVLADFLIDRASKYCLPKWMTAIGIGAMIFVILADAWSDSYRKNIFVLFVYFVCYMCVENIIVLIGEYQDTVAYIHALLPERKLAHDLKIFRRCFLSRKALTEFKKRSYENITPNMPEEQFDELLWQTEQGISSQISEEQRQENAIKNEIEEEKLRKRIEYLCDHIGVVTLITTVGLGVVTTFIKIFIYAYQCGKIDYFGVDHINLNITGGNFLYDLALYLAVVIIYSVACYLLYWIVNNVSKIYKKIFGAALEIIAITGILMLKIVLNENIRIRELGYGDFAAALIATLLIMFPGVFIIFYACYDKEKQVKSKIYFYKFLKPGILGLFLVAIAIYLGIFYSCGTYAARNQKEFKVIDSTGQIVLFENEEVYIVAEYEEKNTTEIYRDEQTILDKKGIKTSNRYFEEVTVIDKEKQD